MKTYRRTNLARSFTAYALAALLGATAITPTSTHAASESDKPYVPPQIQRKHDRREVDIKPYDLNKNGVLDKNEQAASVAGKFAKLDKNKDGRISPEEMAAGGDAYRAQRNKAEDNASQPILDREVKDLEKRLNEADANGDGVVSSAEYNAFQTARLKRMDKDGDGIVDKSEYRLDGEEWSKNKKKK